MNADGPPPGWISQTGIVEPADTVAGYAARVQAVKGICRAKGCNRRVELDPKALCGIGLGLVNMGQVKRLWRCQRIDGCGLDFHEEPPLNPLRLGQFVGRTNVRVRLRCRAIGCKFYRMWRVEEIIAGLEKRRQGDGRTEVVGLGKTMTTACPLCKRVNWTAELLWVSTSSQSWKAKGERSFSEREIG
ncbi:MAG: hypothetical protein ACR2F8_11600 [Caulobacteraceae bacterium]